jgi:hypothetical protein
MAQATLQYDLNDHDDCTAHKRAVKSLDLALCLFDLDQHLRSQLKYHDEALTQEAWDALDQAREKLYSIMNERGVSLDELLD